VLTIDVPFLGLRERDVHNRMDEWMPADMQMANLVRATEEEHPGAEFFGQDSLLFDPSLTWKDLEWLRGLSPLPIVVKGVMTAEDALLAVESGVDAIVVSNHGGRQLDGIAATVDVLPEVVEAVAEPDRGADGRRDPAWERRGQGARAGRAGGPHRSGLPVGPGGGRRARCSVGPGHAADRTRAGHGACRRPIGRGDRSNDDRARSSLK